MYNLYHVQYFVAAAQARSIVAAARQHHVSQSAVSQAIRALEQHFGFPLLTHQRRAFVLTDAAAAILPACEALLADAADLHGQVRELCTGYAGTLRVGCTHTVATHILPLAAHDLLQHYPQLHIDLRIGNSITLREWLASGHIHLGLWVDDGLASPFWSTPVRSGHYVLFRKRHLRQSLRTLGLIVTRQDRREVQAMRNAIFERLGFTPTIRLEIVSWLAIKSYVRSGIGYGICPDYVFDDSEHREGSGPLQIMKLPFTPPTYQLIAVSEKAPGKNSRLLLDTLSAS